MLLVLAVGRAALSQLYCVSAGERPDSVLLVLGRCSNAYSHTASLLSLPPPPHRCCLPSVCLSVLVSLSLRFSFCFRHMYQLSWVAGPALRVLRAARCWATLCHYHLSGHACKAGLGPWEGQWTQGHVSLWCPCLLFHPGNLGCYYPTQLWIGNT